MARRIWLDDERTPPEGWTWVKTVDEAKKLIEESPAHILHMSLDHDLGENQPTGYDLLCWIEQKVADGQMPWLPMFSVHSMNPIGASNMMNAIKSIRNIHNRIYGVYVSK